MNTYTIPQTSVEVSRLAYGCMRIGRYWDDRPLAPDEEKAAVQAVITAVEGGITIFDHADIYSRGKSEAVFAEVWKAMPDLRERIVLQTKCGIRFAGDPHQGDPHRFDFSYEHIVRSVEGSLRRLQTEYVDILLLHRPDPLVEPEEVARAFDALHANGKVRIFGVSNHSVGQIELLQRAVDQPLVINQLQLSLLHPYLIEEGINVDRTDGTCALTGGLLDYCRLKRILIQAWSPVDGGRLFNPPQDAEDRNKEVSALIHQMAEEKDTSPEAIALGWLLRHPAGIQPIIGTTRPERIAASCLADAIEMTRQEWYVLFTAGRGAPMP
jgi:predicted oxidoreductase